jgi:hypothetical protein
MKIHEYLKDFLDCNIYKINGIQAMDIIVALDELKHKINDCYFPKDEEMDFD